MTGLEEATKAVELLWESGHVHRDLLAAIAEEFDVTYEELKQEFFKLRKQ